MTSELKKSILLSYLIGAPIGILVVFATILAPSFLFSDGLLTIVIVSAYGISIVGLVISFLFALWAGGRLAHNNILNGKSLLLTSFKYSLIVNLIIWATFCLIIGITGGDDRFVLMVPPIFAFLVCTILTTFSIGLLISFAIKRAMISNA